MSSEKKVCQLAACRVSNKVLKEFYFFWGLERGRAALSSGPTLCQLAACRVSNKVLKEFYFFWGLERGRAALSSGPTLTGGNYNLNLSALRHFVVDVDISALADPRHDRAHHLMLCQAQKADKPIST